MLDGVRIKKRVHVFSSFLVWCSVVCSLSDFHYDLPTYSGGFIDEKGDLWSGSDVTIKDIF